MARRFLIDGPADLGWERWREIKVGALQDMMHILWVLMDQAIIAKRQPDALVRLNFAAMNEAALSITRAADLLAALAAHSDVLIALVHSLIIQATYNDSE